MRKIDFEAHYYTTETLSALERIGLWDPKTQIIQQGKDCPLSLGAVARIYRGLFDFDDFRLSEMDRFGVTTQILSASPGVEIIPVAESIELARESNNKVAEVIKRHPGRFRGFAVLPVRDVQGAKDELSRCMNELGFVGVLTSANYRDCYPDEDRFAPIFDHLAKLEGCFYLHPNGASFDRLCGYGNQLGLAALGFTIETQITVARLIYNGTFDRNPKLKMILGHCGEAFAVLLDRMDARGNLPPKSPAIKSEHSPSYYFKNNIWVTTSGNFSADAFNAAKNRFGIDHMLFGSDFPYEITEETMTFLDNRPLTVEERECLFYKNAEKFFGIL